MVAQRCSSGAERKSLALQHLTLSSYPKDCERRGLTTALGVFNMLLELQTNATGQNLLALGLAGSLLMLFAYCIYQRFLSPLAKYPGPFWASLTDVWYAYQSAQVDLHRRLIYLHEKYGEIVRVKPNKL